MSELAAIADAFDEPELFGPHFRGGASWDAWRAYLRALTGSPMTEEQQAIYRECTGRTTPPAKPFTESALVVGRRGGKTRVMAYLATALATMRDYEPYLSVGEVCTIGVLAQTKSQGRTAFGYALGLLQNTPSLAGLILDADQEVIRLRNRVQIEIAAASFRSTRGFTYGGVIADEVAFWRSEESLNPDTEILRAIRPGMSTIPGAMLILASSPYAKKGELYTQFRRHFGKDDARVLVWQAPTKRMNPKVDQAVIDEAYEADPESAKAEYGAQFRDDLADFLTREAIDAITAWDRTELPITTGAQYQAFADPSGGQNDSFTLAIGHQEGDVGVLDALLEIRPPLDPDAAVVDCAALLNRFGVKRVVADHYAGQWPVSRFAAHGITFDQSARPKSDIYRDFGPLVNARRVELLDNKRLAAQLIGLERRVARGGRDSIDHPPGAHDDLANAAAGVLVGLDLDRRPTLIRRADLTVAEAGTEHPNPLLVFATVWVGVDGMAAWGLFTYQPNWQPEVVLADFDVGPWRATMLSDVACQIDNYCEAAFICDKSGRMRGVDALLHVPAQLYEAGMQAMTGAFADRFSRWDANHRQMNVLPIAPALLADPAGLVLHASAHISMGRLKLGDAALRRSEGKPLLGTLAIRPGEAVTDDALRTALLVGMAEMNEPAGQADGAGLRFG